MAVCLSLLAVSGVWVLLAFDRIMPLRWNMHGSRMKQKQDMHFACRCEKSFETEYVMQTELGDGKINFCPHFDWPFLGV